jgi:fucose permease
MPVGAPIVHSSQRDRQLASRLHSGFLLVGIVHRLLGPILPMLAVRWRLDDAEAGLLFIAQFTGLMIGSALSSPMIERLGSLRLMAFSYAAMAAAVASLGVLACLAAPTRAQRYHLVHIGFRSTAIFGR